MRIALIAVIVIGTLTILGSLVPTEERNLTRRAPTTTTTTGPAPVVGRPVAFTAPREKAVRAEVGDTLVMTIELKDGDWVRALDLGFEQYLPAGRRMVLRFPATRTGRFELRTRDSDEVLAKLVIADRADRPAGEDLGPHDMPDMSPDPGGEDGAPGDGSGDDAPRDTPVGTSAVLVR